jgi:membrane protease YdiL (CAAX protease family)
MISSSLSPGTTSSATKTGWRVWVALVIAPLLLAALIAAFYAYLGMRSFGTSQTRDLLVNRALPYILMFNHTLLFLLIVWFLHGEGLTLKAVGWQLPPQEHSFLREIGLGMAAGVVLYLTDHYGFTPAITTGLKSLHWASGTEEDSTTYTGAPLAIWMIAVTVFPAVEETLYRGYALTRLRPRLGVVASIFVASAFFAVLHFGEGIDGMLSAAVFGVLVSALFLWRKSLVAPFVAHSVANAIDLLRTIHH